MRTLKFRMWDVEEHTMVDGDSLAFEYYAPLCDLLKDTDEQKFMQYVGIKDENGKEVYEGDIIKMHYFYEAHNPSTLGRYEADAEVIGIVRIDEFGVYTEGNDDCCYRWSEFLESPHDEIEVIGNIYETPDLITICDDLHE